MQDESDIYDDFICMNHRYLLTSAKNVFMYGCKGKRSDEKEAAKRGKMKKKKETERLTHANEFDRAAMKNSRSFRARNCAQNSLR